MTALIPIACWRPFVVALLVLGASVPVPLLTAGVATLCPALGWALDRRARAATRR